MILDIKFFLAVLAAALALIFNLKVAQGTYKKTISPNPVTWGIWVINDALILIASFVLGAKNTLWVPLVYTLTGIFVLALSLRNRQIEIRRVEVLTLSMSLFGWILYFGPGASYAIYLGAFVNAVATIPTFKNVLLDSRRESLSAWVIQLGSSIFMTLSLEKFNWDLLAFPISSNLTCGAMVLLLWRLRDGK